MEISLLILNFQMEIDIFNLMIRFSFQFFDEIEFIKIMFFEQTLALGEQERIDGI